MSKIQGKPFIEELIDSLSKDLRKDLLDLVNGTDKTPEFRSLVNKEHLITGSDKNKVQYIVLETFCKTYTGYLVYNNSYCVLIAFNNNTQALLLVNVDLTKNNCRLIKQPVDILELRMYLRDPTASTTVGEIDSGNTPEGKVMAADGAGGAAWVDSASTIKEDDVEVGDAVKLFGFDSEGNLVADDIPEGITVSNTLSPETEDVAVSGPAVAGYAYSKDEADALLDEKANVDGNYPTMTVGMADNLTPYDESAGDDQDDPFSFQATGTGNSSQADFSTGSAALMKEKRGNTVVVNQQAKEFNATNYPISADSVYNGHTSFSNGVITFTEVPANGNYERLYCKTPLISGHKYLIHFTATVTEGVIRAGFFADGAFDNNSSKSIGVSTVDKSPYFIYQVSTEDEVAILTGVSAQSSGTLKDFIAVDLTQMFNGDIPSDLLSHPENFFRYYQGSLAYNEGELVNANGRYVKCIGRNQWDEEWEVGYISTDNGQDELGYTDRIRSKNYSKAIPNATYYIKVPSGTHLSVYWYDKDYNYVGLNYAAANETVIAPNNALYFRICSLSDYGTTYNHDITISIYYSGESGYDQYYPYEELTDNDTGTEVLRSAGNVCDIKLPDGTIKRNVGYVDLGSLTWGKISDNFFYSEGLQSLIKAPSSNELPNTICPIYSKVYYTLVGDIDKTYGLQSNGTIYIKDSGYNDAAAFKTAMSGVYLFYELAEPTTEAGSSFSENLVIDDFGSMSFEGTNGVPQGNLIFYPVDYKAFIDTLYDYTEGTPSDLALKTDIKDIYCHPIYMRNADNTSRVTFQVFNNSATPFTLTTFKNYVISISGQTGGARVPASGGVKVSASKTAIVAMLYLGSSEGQPEWSGVYADGTEATVYTTWSDIESAFTSFTDTVYKLN